MKSGLHLGRWFGIDVIVHWTFLLLIGLLVVGQLLTGAAWAAVAGSTTLLVAVFLCVLLHEFGHALTGARSGSARTTSRCCRSAVWRGWNGSRRIRGRSSGLRWPDRP